MTFRIFYRFTFCFALGAAALAALNGAALFTPAWLGIAALARFVGKRVA